MLYAESRGKELEQNVQLQMRPHKLAGVNKFVEIGIAALLFYRSLTCNQIVTGQLEVKSCRSRRVLKAALGSTTEI